MDPLTTAISCLLLMIVLFIFWAIYSFLRELWMYYSPLLAFGVFIVLFAICVLIAGIIRFLTSIFGDDGTLAFWIVLLVLAGLAFASKKYAYPWVMAYLGLDIEEDSKILSEATKPKPKKKKQKPSQKQASLKFAVADGIIKMQGQGTQTSPESIYFNNGRYIIKYKLFDDEFVEANLVDVNDVDAKEIEMFFESGERTTSSAFAIKQSGNYLIQIETHKSVTKWTIAIKKA